MASVELPKLPKAANFHLGHPGTQLRRNPSSSDSSESVSDESNMEKTLSRSPVHERWQLIEEYKTEFNQRPKPLSHKATWLLNLKAQKGAGWYLGFCEWYEEQLRQSSKRPRPPSDSLPKLLCESHGKENRIESIAKTLESRSNNDFFYLGNYGAYGLALSLNDFALDPPTMPMKYFTILKLQCARLNMFVGVRPQETKDLCVLTLGNFALFSR